jgi:hypothetical protein
MHADGIDHGGGATPELLHIQYSGLPQCKRHQHLVIIFAAYFQSPPLKPVLFEARCAVKVIGYRV